MTFQLGNLKTLVIPSSGVNVTLATPYSRYDSMGVTVVIIAAGISLLCALAVLGLLAVSMYKKRSSPSEHFFVRTHAAAYFTSLLVADVLQAISSLMSTRWVIAGGVALDPFCSMQGAVKNAGNLAVSLWTLMLAIHTFCLLFLRWKPRDWVLYVTLIGVWLLVGFLVVLGPAAIQKFATKGPYFGISGYWCWISDPYPSSRIGLEYAWMFASAILSFILYTLTFLRLRGNISVEGGRMRFHLIDYSNAWKYQASRDSADIQMTAVAKGMIGFPILFTVIILPIAICRFITWSGRPVPIEATIFADAVFSLSGVFDLILFTATRSLLPARGILPTWFYPRPKISSEVMEHGFQPYNIKDFASAHGFNEEYQSQAERGMMTPPPRTSSSFSSPSTPSRPARPISLGEMHFVPVSPPIPAVPEDDDVKTVRESDRTTTDGSRYSQDDYPQYAAWDEVNLDRSPAFGSPTARDSFGNRRLDRESRGTRYTTFSLSAYEGGSEPSIVPPMPSGAGIHLGAGRNLSDDEDDRGLMSPNDANRVSDASSLSYDLGSVDSGQPQPQRRTYAPGRI